MKEETQPVTRITEVVAECFDVYGSLLPVDLGRYLKPDHHDEYKDAF
jgi:hypothetical protein